MDGADCSQRNYKATSCGDGPGLAISIIKSNIDISDGVLISAPNRDDYARAWAASIRPAWALCEEANDPSADECTSGGEGGVGALQRGGIDVDEIVSQISISVCRHGLG
jgi:hypothetical protein